MNQGQGSPREHSEEQQGTGQDARLQVKLQHRSEVHPGDRGRTVDKLPTTGSKGLLGDKARHASKISAAFSVLIPASKICLLES